MLSESGQSHLKLKKSCLHIVVSVSSWVTYFWLWKWRQTYQMCEHNTSSASWLLIGRKISSWEKKHFAVEKEALALVSRKWKAGLCICRKSSECRQICWMKACIGEKVNSLVNITVTSLYGWQRVQIKNQKYVSWCLPLLAFVFKCLAGDVVESAAFISLMFLESMLKFSDEDLSSWIAWDLKTK